MGELSVFPAQAGVILLVYLLRLFRRGFPRASGGDPHKHWEPKVTRPFTPRKRG